MRCLSLSILILIVPLACAGELWVFLKDGRVGLGDPARQPITLTLADGQKATAAPTEIAFQRTREEVAAGVKTMFNDIVRAKNIEEHAKRFHVLQAAAVSPVLEYLKEDDSRYRLGALFALQYCWAPQAEEPVYKAFNDRDPAVRKTAFGVLAKQIPALKLAEKLQTSADGDNLDAAALVFEVVDKHHPDPSLKRIQRLLQSPNHRSAALARLSHYLSPSLTDDTLKLLEAKDAPTQRYAVVGLISQLAGSDAVRARVVLLLSAQVPDLREIAAEYLTWLGEHSDLSALQSALLTETDLYCRAALQGAIKTVENRRELWKRKPSLAAELKALQTEQVLEPSRVYGTPEHGQEKLFTKRFERLQELLAAPAGVLKRGADFDDAAKYEPSAAFVPPLRDYFDPNRRSFGVRVSGDYVAFAGSVHIGDDAGWSKELRTVVAVAPGVVRRACHIPSWGFIVVVEHALPDNRHVCSVYAHLSAMLLVKPGEVLAAGQKIGSLGRHHSVENGGYGAHIHFGLHSGPFSIEAGGWVHGYISVSEWETPGHGWLDPQFFLKQNAHAIK